MSDAEQAWEAYSKRNAKYTSPLLVEVDERSFLIGYDIAQNAATADTERWVRAAVEAMREEAAQEAIYTHSILAARNIRRIVVEAVVRQVMRDKEQS